MLHAAEAARAVARSAPPPRTRELVLGIPAGPLGFLRPILANAVGILRAEWPEARVVCRRVPFVDLTSSLVEEEIDVLWTAAAVAHRDVESVPLGVTVDRMGMVPALHPLAEAGSVGVEEFAALPLLYNPRIPDEWMSVFYLGDVRPRSEAQLVSADPRDVASVGQESLRRQTVAVAPAMLADFTPPQARLVRLEGASPIRFHAAWRRHEPRGAVRSLVEALRAGVGPGLPARPRAHGPATVA